MSTPTRTDSDTPRRTSRSRPRPQRATRQRRRSSPRFEHLEDRSLLSSLVFADGFGNSPTTTPATADAVASDPGGATYLTGGFGGKVIFGNLPLTSQGSTDVYIAKLNPSGTVAWVHRGGGANANFGDYGRAIAVDSQGNSYITGYFTGPGSFEDDNHTINLPGNGANEIFVAKYDIAGNLIWAKSFGGSGADFGQSIALDDQGNLYVTGSFQNSMTVGATTLTSQGFNDAFVMKLDPSGTPVWAKSFGGVGDDNAYSIGVDAQRNAYVAGDFSGSVQFGGTTLPGHGPNSDGFILKLDGGGNVSWVKGIGGTSGDGAYGLTVNGSDVYATGGFTAQATIDATTLNAIGNSQDIFLAKINAAGTLQWAKSFGGTSLDLGYGLTTDASGNVYATGQFFGTATYGTTTLTSNGSYDALLVKFDPDGNVLSAQNFGSTDQDKSMMATISPINGNVTVVGDYSGAMSVDGVALPATGSAFAIQWSQSAIQSTPPGDFLGIGYTAPSLYDPSTAGWTATGASGLQDLGPFGTPGFGTIPTPGDYEGVGHAQLAYFDPQTAHWFVKSDNGSTTDLGAFGGRNLLDIPVPGDYDGTGRTQIAVFRSDGWAAQWYVKRGNGGQLLAKFGAANMFDIPVPGDYDGTGRTQIAVFRPSTGQWFVLRPNGGQLLATFGGRNLLDIPIPGDWDNVGHTEPAVYRPSTGQIFVLGAQGGHLLTTLPANQWNYAQIPLLASMGSLLKLGTIQSGTTSAVHGLSAAQGTPKTAALLAGPAATAQNAVASAPAAATEGTSTTARTAPAAPVVSLARSSVVVNQDGSRSSKKDAVSAALDDLVSSGSLF